MDTLLFIRHAETDLAGRFCGQSDPPINKRGHRQIAELLSSLEGESFDAIYTSDLSRAFTTAAMIGQAFSLSPIAVPGLREISFGEWEGLSWEEIESRDRDSAGAWSQAYPYLPAPGGERFEAFQSRVLTEVNLLLTSSSPGSVAVVTHGGVMRVILRSLCGLDEKEAWERTKAYCGFFRYQSGRLI
jgi:alpha-ribazole phosphatase/probable phosphoglycerate mutase